MLSFQHRMICRSSNKQSPSPVDLQAIVLLGYLQSSLRYPLDSQRCVWDTNDFLGVSRVSNLYNYGILRVLWCINSYKSVLLGFHLSSLEYPLVPWGFCRWVWDTNVSPGVCILGYPWGFLSVLCCIRSYKSVFFGCYWSFMEYPLGPWGSYFLFQIKQFISKTLWSTTRCVNCAPY